ncbi:hypothetical protein IWX90DRAFT_115408 [Phyllosticta citrichinensis]|uniref:Uncharacterized protein n=1 Tax=Phyllosticta citrichinensis TaxID=1130410 RepID=A0ABR1Y301_9PEZI
MPQPPPAISPAPVVTLFSFVLLAVFLFLFHQCTTPLRSSLRGAPAWETTVPVHCTYPSSSMRWPLSLQRGCWGLFTWSLHFSSLLAVTILSLSRFCSSVNLKGGWVQVKVGWDDVDHYTLGHHWATGRVWTVFGEAFCVILLPR